MVKTVGLDDMTHARLVALAGRLSTLAMKPVPLGLAANYAIGVTEGRLDRMLETERQKLGAFLRSIDPKEIEEEGDKIYRLMMGE